MKWRIVTLCVAAALIAGSAAAQNNSSNGLNDSLNESNLSNDTALQDNQSLQTGINTVIVASSESHIDATLADAASDRLGVPVVLTDPDSLSDSTRQAMTDVGVERAVIIGGPVALSENVEEQINSLTEDEAVRVFGTTASDTSVEVADYFWPNGYNQTTIVQARLMEEQDDTYRLLSAAMNTAEANPVLITEINETEQEQVVNEVTSTDGVNQVNAYTVDTATNNSLEDSLAQLNIETQVNQGSVDELSTQLYSEIQDNPDNRTLFAVSGSNYEYGIPTYSHPDGTTYIVTEDRINQSVEYIDNSEYSEINTIGEQSISDQITEQVNTSIQNQYVPVNNVADTSVQILRDNAEEWPTQRNEELLAEIGLVGESSVETNQTENQTNLTEDNLTSEDETETGIANAESSIGLTSNSSAVTAEATFTSNEPYTQVQDVETNQTHITFTFELVPTADMPEQDQYNYSFNESLQPESGDYQTRAELVVNNRTIDSATGNAQIQ